MKIHREGTRILIGSFLIFLAIPLGLYFFTFQWLGIVVGLILFVLYGFIVWFFRNPDRETNAESNQIVAPVDGEVVAIETVYEKEFIKGECQKISIFMSPLNVHVCRYPVSGKVIYTKYHPGKFLVAWHPKSSELNERTTVVVENQNTQKVLFRQIAGAVARRIVLYAKENDNATAGSEYGFIKFGSRLDIYLPMNAKIHTKIGDKPVGAVDIIAELV